MKIRHYNIPIFIPELACPHQCLFCNQRSITVEDVEKASLLINDFGFELGLQMMVGLPKDNKSKAIETAEKIINLKAKTTRIYPCLVIKDTALETLFRKGEYRAISIENAVDISKILLQKFENSGVKVLRVGLHQSEALIEGDSLVAGPFHKSFRELVESSIWRDQLLEKLKNCSGESLKVFVGKGRINRNSPKEFLKVLKNRNLSFKFGKNLVGENYPNSAHYNAVVNSNFLIHNLQITDSEIINSCQDKKLINVRQGYVRCNLISLPDGSFICSDMGIYKELKKQNIEVLFVNPNGIELPDFPNGFIGGTMGFNNGKLFILGSLKYFSEGEKIEHFLDKKSIEIVELYDGALFDGGGLFFI